MDENVGEIDSKYRADLSFMTLLRSSVDNVHKKVRSTHGPIQCLYETSQFYELAIIQIDACFKFFEKGSQDQFLDTKGKNMLIDLGDLKGLFHERLNKTKYLITEKDKELVYLQAKLEPETPNLPIFDPKSRSYGDKESKEKVKNDQNVMIEQMCSDIDVLKETLDLAFGLVHQDDSTRPLEKQFRWWIEKETILIMIRGFVRDLKIHIQKTIDDVTKRDAIIMRLMEEKRELNLQTMSMEEHYMILLNDCHKEFYGYEVETKVREDVFVYALREVAKDWSTHAENESIQRQVVDDICRYVYNETINDFEIKLDIQLQKIQQEKLVYKKAFARRCENLLLAETEVDLLGDQVEALQDLLRKIYFVLDQNSSALSHNIQVMDILKLIKKQLSG
ncbi:WPP domain-associated protein [Tanacetum coccineum]